MPQFADNQRPTTHIVTMFLYFDLGNVLLYFDHEIAWRQMAAVASPTGKQITADTVRHVVAHSGLEDEYEAGKLTTAEFYERFCRETGTHADMGELMRAASDIFWPNVSIKPVIGALLHARHRLGLLSNTNEAHWKFVSQGRYGLVPGGFEVLALSFQIGAIKPDPRIFARAAELASVPRGEIFYTDDRAEHVAAARQAGFDAVVYTSTPQLVAELRRRGVAFNY
jgi:HAD superfamily hydrolase (TIGR01509 family)